MRAVATLSWKPYPHRALRSPIAGGSGCARGRSSGKELVTAFPSRGFDAQPVEHGLALLFMWRRVCKLGTQFLSDLLQVFR